MNERLPLRQGDVLLVPVDELPEGLAEIPRSERGIVVAEGEATGHAHVLEGEASLLASDVEDLENRFLAVEEEAQLVHDEHDPIAVPPGPYRVTTQREYTEAGGVQRVAD